MASTLIQVLQNQQVKTELLSSAAQTVRQQAIVTTRGGLGNAVTPVLFTKPFLATQPYVSYGFVITAGPILPNASGGGSAPASYAPAETYSMWDVPVFTPRMAGLNPPSGTQYVTPGPISCGGVWNWITYTDDQGKTVYTGANVILHIEWKSGVTDSSGSPGYCDGTIQHHYTFEGTSYNRVPTEVST